MRLLALPFFICWPLFSQAVTNPANPTNNPNQVNVTTSYLYLNKMHYAGTYSAIVSYNSQDVVFASSIAYISLQAGNLAHTPASSGLWWIAVPGGGGGGGTWGSISGTLSDQTDLNTALGLRAAKASNLSDLASASTARTNLGLGTAAVMTGPAGAIVGTTDTQALTNKTLDGISPTIMGYLGTISSDIQTQVTARELAANKDAASGYAGLTSGSLLKAAEFPAFTGDCTTSSGAVAIACGAAIGRTGNPLSQFVNTTSAQLAGVISDETGSGALVFGTSPVFTTPALGTPSGIVLTNATSLPNSALTTAARAGGFQVSFGGSDAAAGVTQFVTIPYACTITDWIITADAGTATVKLWRIADGGSARPTVSNTLSTSGFALASGTRIHSTTLSDLSSTAIAAYDTFGVNLFAASGVVNVTFTLGCQR